MFDVSLAAANFWFDAANIALLIGAIIIAIGTYGVFKMGAIKERFSEERISANETLTAAAKADVAHANENTEILRKSNLALQADLERERAARLHLEGKIAPRHLSAAQKEALVAALKPFSGQVVDVAVPMGDTEAKAFAEEFVGLFRAAGWNAGANDGISQAVYTGPPIRGIQVTLNEADVRANKLPHGAGQLIQTLIGLGLARQAYVNPQTASGKIEFRVGSKEE